MRTRRFGWSMLMVLTLGLVYPFMVGNLWRYRYLHTWYGDRQFGFTGSWQNVAGPVLPRLFRRRDPHRRHLRLPRRQQRPSSSSTAPTFPRAEIWLMGLVIAARRCSSASTTTARASPRGCSPRSGSATPRVTVKVRARSLIGQLLLYCLALTGAGIGFLDHRRDAARQHHDHRDGRRPVQRRRFRRHDPDQLGHHRRRSSSAISSCSRPSRSSARSSSATATGCSSPAAPSSPTPTASRTVRATAEDLALHGEGLADALNVGAY